MFIFLIRNYNYGPLALGNALEKICWMSGPARGDIGKQKEMVTKFCNRVLAENAAKGANMEPPLTYKEVIETAAWPGPSQDLLKIVIDAALKETNGANPIFHTKYHSTQGAEV